MKVKANFTVRLLRFTSSLKMVKEWSLSVRCYSLRESCMIWDCGWFNQLPVVILTIIKYTNTLCGQIREFLNVELIVRRITALPSGAKFFTFVLDTEHCLRPRELSSRFQEVSCLYFCVFNDAVQISEYITLNHARVIHFKWFRGAIVAK
jgi:hypothetical protein